MGLNLGNLTRGRDGYLVNPNGSIYGYCRVSTKDQSLARQLDAMAAYGVREAAVFSEQQSGKNFNRTAYKRMIHILRKGDILVIKSIDRLGRNYNEILEQWRLITQDLGCGIHVLDMPSLNTSGDPDDLISRFITDMMLQVLSFVAQNERETTIKRQKEGIAAAKKRGVVKIGRPKIKIPFEFWEIFILWKTHEIPTKKIVEMCKEEYGMSMRTFYRRIHELDSRYGDIPPNELRNLIVEDDFKDGIEFDFERCESGMGIIGPYMYHPEYNRGTKEYKKRLKVAGIQIEEDDPEESAHSQEEELKRIILEKRQKEFRQKFGIRASEASNTKDSLAKLSKTKAGREALRMAESAMTSNIKTIVID